LDRIELLLDRGDARAAMQRLGKWVDEDSRALGARGVSLLARAALQMGRADLAYAHAMQSHPELNHCQEEIEAALRASIVPKREALRVDRGGAWFEAGADRVSLERRPRLRRLLAALIEQPEGLTPDDLFARVWPERRVSRSVITNRVDVSIARLRSLGLRDHIVREPGWIKLVAGWEAAS
jgi:hypothetical protein